MSLSDNEKKEQFALYSLETFQKMVLGFIPGGHLVDVFLDFRSTLKQKRVLEFSESVRLAMKDIGGVDIDNFTTEEFVDVMDSIYKRVQETSSELKLRYFQNILLRQVVNPIDNQFVKKFIRLVDELNEIQLILLEKLIDCLPVNNITDIQYFIVENPDSINYEDLNSPVIIKIVDEEVSTTLGEIEFYIRELVSFGLINYDEDQRKNSNPRIIRLIEEKDGRMQISPAQYYISIIGELFINMIKSYQ